jgi:hypothetical protein
MLDELNIEQRKLAEYMSEISERCLSAAWIHDLEFELWNAVLTGPRKFGHDFITAEDLTFLIEQSKKSNSWIIFSDSADESALDLSKWETTYNAASFISRW